MGSGASAAAKDAKATWQHVYCAMVMCHVKDPKTAMPVVMERATGEVKADVEGVPGFTVLGEATNFANDAAKEYMKNKLQWFCLYDTREAVFGRMGPHDDWVMNKFLPLTVNQDIMKDMECSYTGFVDYLSKPGATSADNFYMMGSFMCKSEDAVKAAMDTIKAHGDEMIQKEDGAVGCLVIPPASHDSDMMLVYECEADDLDKFHVTYLLAFKDKEAWDFHQKQDSWAPFLYKLVESLDDVENDIKIQLWFDNAITLVHGSEYGTKKEEKKEPSAAPKSLAKAINSIDKHQIKELKSLDSPSELVLSLMQAVFLILSDKKTEVVPEWKKCQKMMSNTTFLNNLKQFVSKPSIDFKAIASKLKDILAKKEFTTENLKKASAAAGPLCTWVICINDWCKDQETPASPEPPAATEAPAEKSKEAAPETPAATEAPAEKSKE